MFFLETVNRLDQSVGQIIETLSQTDQLKNSVILFLSDNGAQTFGEHENFGSNWPLRGVKTAFNAISSVANIKHY